MRRITPSSGVASCNFFVAMFVMLGAISLNKSVGLAVAVILIAVSSVVAIAVNILVYRKLGGRVGAVKYIFFSALPWLLWIFAGAVLMSGVK
ncbi:MAG: hypothetical protein IJZ95_00370 [Oscillospiraceae bacterium]|nr:hypothetical protein [Oscillospiraceae bacterium]